MAGKRKVQVFTAGCPICDEAVEKVRRMACESCEIEVLDVSDHQTAERAATLGVRSVPAVAIDGELASCCSGRGIDKEVLHSAGIGRPR